MATIQDILDIKGNSVLSISPDASVLDAASLNPHGMFPGEMFPAGEIPDDMVLADFNGDGNSDVATTDRDAQEIAVLLGRGDGTFADPLRFPVGSRPLSIAAANRSTPMMSIARQ